MVAGYGPSLAGVVVVALTSGQSGLKVWLKACLNWRVNWRWYAFAFFAPFALMLSTIAIYAAINGVTPVSPFAGNVPLAIANFAIVLVVGGPMGEEFGWRAYAMPWLTAKFSWRTASLIIGIIWGLWHLPLFYISGTAQSQMPLLVFMLNIIAGSVVFGWLYQHTRPNIVPSIVLHVSLNAWAGILIIVPTSTIGGPFAMVTTLLVIMAMFLLVRRDRMLDMNVLSKHRTDKQISR